MINLNDTIAAIATSFGDAGIGIVRLSGKDALAIADKIFISNDGQRAAQFKTYTLHYGHIFDPGKSNSKYIDEVLLTVMRAPKSFTKEDVVEINCHGGIIALRAVLELVLANGCRIAEPGEFTRRAFLNGRIDLAQAEAVLDVIKAKTDSALRVGINQLKGNLSQEVNLARQTLLEVLVILEANIDFPEEEISAIDFKKISGQLAGVNQDLIRILDSSKAGRIMREGINVVICGRPNVGKSSLLNALLKQERSIVTPIAGTTRDTIEEIIDIKGIPVRIVDTAGIIEPRDLIEKKAIQRSKQYIQLADLIILLFDSNKRLDKQDEIFMNKLAKKPVIAVLNKIDLKVKIQKEEILKKFKNTVEISAKKMRNIDLLEEAIASLVYKGETKASESVIVSNLRHIELVRKAQKYIAETLDSLDNKLPLEFIAQGIKDAMSSLDILLGVSFTEDLLDKIFSKFCIGK